MRHVFCMFSHLSGGYYLIMQSISRVLFPSIYLPKTLTLQLSLNLKKLVVLPVDVFKTARRVANSVYPGQTPPSAASDQGLHCLLMSVCQFRVNTECKV